MTSLRPILPEKHQPNWRASVESGRGAVPSAVPRRRRKLAGIGEKGNRISPGRFQPAPIFHPHPSDPEVAAGPYRRVPRFGSRPVTAHRQVRCIASSAVWFASFRSKNDFVRQMNGPGGAALLAQATIGTVSLRHEFWALLLHNQRSIRAHLHALPTASAQCVLKVRNWDPLCHVVLQWTRHEYPVS